MSAVNQFSIRISIGFRHITDYGVTAVKFFMNKNRFIFVHTKAIWATACCEQKYLNSYYKVISDFTLCVYNIRPIDKY
jgi:hypothetical protein